MRSTNRRMLRAAVAVAVGISTGALSAPGWAEVPATQPASAGPTTRPVVPKPLSEQVNKGLDWLVKHQQKDGGWSQGERSMDQYRQGEVGDTSNVADTCMAALALMRAGSTPAGGPYAQNVSGAMNFVCAQVEKAPQEGLFITDIKGTRVQTKLGQYIDTFAAALFLAQLKPVTPDPAVHKRLMAALDKTMNKIEKNQKQDGRWVEAHDGWASTLCQSVATKAVNVAAQNGATVNPEVVERAQKFAAGNFDEKSRAVSGAGSANVELYARASNLASFQDTANTDARRKGELDKQSDDARGKIAKAQQQLQEATTQPTALKPEQLAQARQAIAANNAVLRDVEIQNGRITGNATALANAQAAVVDRFSDKQFVAGFGSNGGEEFLSYMNIGESLVLKGGDEFAKWDKGMTENLNRIQNDDGSWTGDHCITGRTFCTAAALLTLTVDRSAAKPQAQEPGADK